MKYAAIWLIVVHMNPDAPSFLMIETKSMEDCLLQKIEKDRKWNAGVKEWEITCKRAAVFTFPAGK